MLKELYSQYGEIMVQMEVLQARLNKVKTAIFAELQPKQKTECCSESKEDCCDKDG